jgi:hypothetical protein
MYLLTKLIRWESVRLVGEDGRESASAVEGMGDGTVGFLPVYGTEKAALLASEDGLYRVLRIDKPYIGSLEMQRQ